MKKVKIISDCSYIPGDAADKPENRVPAHVGQVVTVTNKRAEKMIAGNVAVAVVEEKKEPEKKTVPLKAKKAKPKAAADGK